MSELVLIQPESQAWWKGGEVPFRVVELNGRREVMVNVTAMLAGVGKTWSNYKKLVGTEELIAHAEQALLIGRAELIQTETAPGPSQGTWAIKTIALDAAAWASTPLRWWMLETALAKLEGRSNTQAPGSPWSLQTVADFGRSMVLLAEGQQALAEGQQAQQIQLNTLTADMQVVKEEIRKSDLQRACEKWGVPHPSEWQKTSIMGSELEGSGLYWIGDPLGDPEKPHYIGESENLYARLYRKRNQHEGLRFLGATGRCYETRVLRGFPDKQVRTNLEDALTAASQPHWKFNSVYKKASADLSQFKTKAYPLHNYQSGLLPYS